MEAAAPVERHRWNQRVLAGVHPHFLQSWEWGEIKTAHGWRVHRLQLSAGVASLLARGAAGVSVAYAPKAPVCDWDDPLALERCLRELEEAARGEGAIFLKVDPDLPVGHPGEGVLERLGWRRSPEQIQFRNTLLVSLDGGEEALLGAMKAKTRYNVRLAGRRGVEVREVGPEALPRFYDLYRQTARRQGFPIRPRSYYHSVWRTLLATDMGVLLVAVRQERELAFLFGVSFGPRAHYLYGASQEEGREHMPAYLLQWEAMRWAKRRGCRVYDLWGAPEDLQASDPMWGVYRFKEGFGGRLFRGSGAWDRVLRPGGYWLYRQVIPRLLALGRRLQALPGGPGAGVIIHRARPA